MTLLFLTASGFVIQKKSGYQAQRIWKNIRTIRDIQEAHKKDSESALLITVADELWENLEEVENFKGNRQEKQAFLYYKQLGINYKSLSEEEFRWLIRILQKSKKMGTSISQRKKRK